MQPNMMFTVRGTSAPTSNTERQRQFRRRNPGYYQRLHAERRAVRRELAAVRKAAEAMAAAMAAMAAKPVPLMLPAPVETIAMPGVNAIPATLAELHALRALEQAGLSAAMLNDDGGGGNDADADDALHSRAVR